MAEITCRETGRRNFISDKIEGLEEEIREMALQRK